MPECSFAVVSERHLKWEVQDVSWSPNRDLIAMSCANGELMLYRLSSLERVWMLAPPGSGVIINSVCWRPDGNVISVAYDSKECGVAFVEMEKAQIAWSLNEGSSLKNVVSTLNWFECCEIKDFTFERRMSCLNMKDYIPSLSPLTSKDVKSVDSEVVLGENRFNLLMCCDDKNSVTAYAYGMFPVFVLDMQDVMSCEADLHISSVLVSPDMQYLSINGIKKSDSNSDYFIQIFKLSSVLDNILETNEAVRKCCQLVATLSYIKNVLDMMNESCETVVQDMESKLTKFLVNKSMPGTIGDEFLEMLLWGKPSEIVEDLLVNCITARGINKMGTQIETSYSSIQKLLLDNFFLASDTIYYLLNDLKGMCTPNHFGFVKLLEIEEIEKATKIMGSMYLKSVELQQVIGENLHKFKVFFRWLYYTAFTFKEPPPPESSQMTQSQLELVADVIMESFIHEHEQLKQAGRERHFNLDKVSQYLRDSPLVSPIKNETNEWHHLVDTTPCLAHCPLILERKPDASLGQLFGEVRRTIFNMVYNPKLTLTRSHVIIGQEVPAATPGDRPLFRQWFSQKDSTFFSISYCPNTPGFQATRVSTKGRSAARCRCIVTSSFADLGEVLESGDSPNPVVVLDVSTYNETTMTFLLKCAERSYLAQVSLPLLGERILSHASDHPASSPSPDCDVTTCITEHCSVSGISPAVLASSGTRKVSCLVATSRRHLRAYDMDQVNGEDDPDVSMATTDGE